MASNDSRQAQSNEAGSADRSDLLGRLTLEEKAMLTAGVDMWTTAPVPRLGIPSLRMTDGPSGARGRYWGPAATRAVAFPTGSALGATWDPSLIREVGAELGRETIARGADLLLGPTVNPQRGPLAGRTFECLSEDPHLTGVLGAEYVKGLQSEGVAATVKHLAGNEAEWQRHSVDTVVDERTLREVYLAPFEPCIDAGALAVMTAYNRLNGDHCPNEAWLLRDILRGEWGFDGIVMTDWWGLLDTTRAAVAGLDIEMPGPERAYGKHLAAAVRRGDVDEQTLDDIVARLLSAVERLRGIDAKRGAELDDRPEWSRDNDEAHRFARRVAASAMVLIKNDPAVLPLDTGSVKRIAVLGPNAVAASIMGGGSSQVRAQHRTPPLDVMRRRWSGVEVVHETGTPAPTQPSPLEPWEMRDANGRPGFLVEYYTGTEPSGNPAAVHEGDDFRIQFMGGAGDGVPAGTFLARAAATFTAAVGGVHEFVLRSNARARLLVDGKLADDLDSSGDRDWFGQIHELRHQLQLTQGQQIHLAVEFDNPPFDTYGRTSLACVRPVHPDSLSMAVDAAAASDVAVVVVGTSDLVESEGFDRTTLSLPEGHDELVARVAEANPRTIVVVNSGGPVAMPWLDDVPAVIQSWFGGQELGDALVDVIEGAAEPAGRMPFTVPHRIEDTPTYGNFPGEAGQVRYGEGLLIGHRWYDSRGIDVAVPFGHGGSYTTFDWSDVTIPAGPITAGDPIAVEVTVTNTGSRPGSDVVQIYLSPPPDTPLFRPKQELKGFAKVHLEPGESERVAIELDGRAFAYWTPRNSAAPFHDEVRSTPFRSTVPAEVPAVGWTIHPGTYEITVARSINDPAITASVRIDNGVNT